MVVCLACNWQLAYPWGLCKCCCVRLRECSITHYCAGCGWSLDVSQRSCPRCREGSCSWDRVWSPYYFEGIWKDIVVAAKTSFYGYAYVKTLLCYCLWQMDRHGKWEILQPSSVLVPVPMYWKKASRGGFNLPALVAWQLGRSMGISVCLNALKRSWQQQEQKSLSAKERKWNVKHAFTASRKALRGKQVVLIDDVITTGSTVKACALLLKSMGASSVEVVSLAQARLLPEHSA